MSSGYTKEDVLNGEKAYKICKLLMVDPNYPKDMADILDISPGTVRNIIPRLRELDFIEKTDSPSGESGRKQFYRLKTEGIFEYWLDRQANVWEERKATRNHKLFHLDLKDSKDEMARELFELEEKLEGSDEITKSQRELWRDLRSYLGYLMKVARVSDEEIIEIKEEKDKNPDISDDFNPGLELEVIKAGEDPKGVEELVKDYFKEYLAQNEGSNIGQMIGEDFRKAVFYIRSEMGKEDADIPAINFLYNLHHARLNFRKNNPYSALTVACLRNSKFDSSFLESSVDYAINQGDLEEEYKEVIVEAIKDFIQLREGE